MIGSISGQIKAKAALVDPNRYGRSDRSQLGRWFWEIDRVLLLLVAVLIGIGLIAVAAASPAAGQRYSGGSVQFSGLHYFYRQIFWIAVGLPVMIGISMLTRDRALLVCRTVTHGCYVHARKPEAQLQEAVGSPYPERAIPISLSVNYLLTPGRGMMLTASTHIPNEFFSFNGEEGAQHAAVRIAGGEVLKLIGDGGLTDRMWTMPAVSVLALDAH